MAMMGRFAFVVLLTVAALPLLLDISGGEPTSESFRLAKTAQPHMVGGATWMARNLTAKLRKQPPESATVEGVFTYIDLIDRYHQNCQAGWDSPSTSNSSDCQILRAELDARGPAVERLVQQQVAGALESLGSAFNLGLLKTIIPPVMFTFQAPPTLLVVSPRSEIKITGRVLLDPELTLRDAERLEKLVSSREVSAMVTRIGGLGIYPSILPENPDLPWILQTVAHEWCHQFFAFKPLGWRYAFGMETDQRMIAINETAAELIGKEVGNRVYRQSYGGSLEELSRYTPRQLYLREQLRELRRQVDLLLDEGQIAQAEALMEARRQELNAQGYDLRVLNQAYFAFYGSYADDPYLSGTEIEEISRRIRRLREKSTSAGSFLAIIASAGSYEEFIRITNE